MKKNHWHIKWAEITANMQDYNNAQLPRYKMGVEGGGMQSQTNQLTML